MIWLIALHLFGCAPAYRPVDFGAGGYPDLRDTPFFAQEAYQCGPAALAMVLAASGIRVRPKDLVPLTYVPKRRGSFQLELLAAARTFGRIPYVIDPNLESLAGELGGGRPVLVLQNYGLGALTAYHYAVVIGMQPEEKVILRSGTHRRHIMKTSLFLGSWLRPGAWGMVCLRPGELPENADPKRIIRAAAAFEKVRGAGAARPAFEAACSRWPMNSLVVFAAGNNAVNGGRLDKAEQDFLRVLKIDPDHLGALNNLAHILALEGRFQEAEQRIQRAVVLAQNRASVLLGVVMATQKEIRELALIPR